METKEFKIIPPEGYEVDKENSTFERIVFKKKDDKPRSWEEFCKRGFTGEEGYISVAGVSKTYNSKGDIRNKNAVGYVDSVEEAEAFIALMQLRQLRKAWVGDWEPDWKDFKRKYTIEVNEDYIHVYPYNHTNRSLSFPTEEMANEFMAYFTDLLEIAKILL